MQALPVEMFYWNRVVIDEFTYNNERDNVAIVTGVKAAARWVLSGTPDVSGFSAVAKTAQRPVTPPPFGSTGRVRDTSATRPAGAVARAHPRLERRLGADQGGAEAAVGGRALRLLQGGAHARVARDAPRHRAGLPRPLRAAERGRDRRDPVARAGDPCPQSTAPRRSLAHDPSRNLPCRRRSSRCRRPSARSTSSSRTTSRRST